MPGFGEINQELDELTRAMQVLAFQVDEARAAYETAKMNYELAYARSILDAKARNPDMTQTDLEAHATVTANEKHLEMLTAKSRHRRLQVDLKSSQTRLEALMEKSYNLRLEAKLLGRA